VPRPGTAGTPLPLADEAHRLRGNLKYFTAAFNAARTRLGCHMVASGRSPAGTQGQLTGRRNFDVCRQHCDWGCVLPTELI